jgi:DNA-binding CsgD family transcriptional regulator
MWRSVSEREKEILLLLSQGLTAVEIGTTLHISHKTVEWHVSQAQQKLRARNRIQTVVNGLRLGLIPWAFILLKPGRMMKFHTYAYVQKALDFIS